MAFLKRLIRALPLLVLSPLLMAISFLALFLVQLFTRRGGKILPADVAQGVPSGPVPAVSRLVSTPVRGHDTASQASVGMSADAAAKSACATATVVIPNWNGKDLLAKYIPSIRTALAGNPANEILVVDNGSSDGSADFLRENFPEVTVLALPENLGFGGGSNAGFRAARNDIVVLLNSDMRVAADFLAPLLEGFGDAEVFAVSCQIYFTDSARLQIGRAS